MGGFLILIFSPGTIIVFSKKDCAHCTLNSKKKNSFALMYELVIVQKVNQVGWYDLICTHVCESNMSHSRTMSPQNGIYVNMMDGHHKSSNNVYKSSRSLKL